MSVTVFSPAKINLFLAINPRRPDGFHDLVSVVAPLDFGDELSATASGSTGSQFTLHCDHPEVPTDGGNLILKAAAAFVAATGWTESVDFKLTKRIPMGAGLGGGSSNAVAALRALNQLSGGLLPADLLAAIAASLGSDCALFLHDAPVVIRGRGERVESLPETAVARLRGRRVLLFKPSFGISTPWAYGRMVAVAPRDYWSTEAAEQKLASWRDGAAPAEALLSNSMERVAFEKFIALPVLADKLRATFAVAVQMSGSGSAFFALLPETAGDSHLDQKIVAAMKEMIGESWGSFCFREEVRIA